MQERGGIYSLNADAKRKRGERQVAGVAFAAIKSQLQVAKKHLKKRIANPSCVTLLEQHQAQLAATQRRGLRLGDRVHFVRPGPRRLTTPGRGNIVAFPDKKKLFVAVDRSEALHKPKLAMYIDVVPVEHVWL